MHSGNFAESWARAEDLSRTAGAPARNAMVARSGPAVPSPAFEPASEAGTAPAGRRRTCGRLGLSCSHLAASHIVSPRARLHRTVFPGALLPGAGARGAASRPEPSGPALRCRRDDHARRRWQMPGTPLGGRRYALFRPRRSLRPTGRKGSRRQGAPANADTAQIADSRRTSRWRGIGLW